MYFNDEIEADPMSWEEHMFDEAEAAYKEMDRMKEQWDSSEMTDFPHTPYDNMNPEEYILTSHWFKHCFDDCSITEEQWKKMVTWSKRNYEEKTEWFKFCAMHRLNLTEESGVFWGEEWSDDELFNTWESWKKTLKRNRINLLDKDAKEFELLGYFIENAGIALSREQILSSVWEYDYDGDEDKQRKHYNLKYLEK